jgi:large subunit ribosomal protein L3
MKAILAQKIEMTHIFDEKGNFVPVTLLWAEGNVVTQVKTSDVDGYDALQIGFGKAKNLAKPQAGHLKKAKAEVKHLREVELENGKTYQVGDEVKVDIFEEGELVTVQATSKGKGFAGTIRRHNFHRGPKTHGSHNYRAPGSIGSMFPQHVVKGKKLPGRHGGFTSTVKNQKIAKIMVEDNLILLRGAVPGPRKSLVLVTAVDKKVEA